MKSYLHLLCLAILLSVSTTLLATPNVSFTATPTSGSFPLLVNFNASATSDSQSGTLQYFWDFGDGGQTSGTGSIGKTASHTYTTNGTFTATLTVMNLTTFATSSKTKTITVTVPTGTYSYPVDAIQDAYWNGSSSTNSNMLHVGGGKTAYLKYTIPNLPGNITAAKLQFTYSLVGIPQSGTIKVQKGSNTNWTETNLTNSNRPSATTTIGNVTTTTSAITYNRAISLSHISEGGVINLILSSTNSSAHWFASAEESFETDRPRLILTVNNSGTTAPTIQTGKKNIVTSSSTDWDQVNFPTAFSQTPIVVAGPPSFNGGNQSTVRIKSVTKTGFQIQVDEWDYLDGAHTSETISYIAAVPGTHTLGSLKMKAGSVTSVDHDWKTATYSGALTSTPVVMASQVTNGGGQATTVRLTNISKTGFSVKVQEEEANDDIHAKEIVHYMAFTTGTGSLNGKTIKVGKTGRSIRENWAQINFGTTLSNAGFVAAMQSYYGGDCAALRYKSLTSTGVQVKVEEETSANVEVAHTTEVVGYVVIKNAATTPAPSNEDSDEIDNIVESRGDETRPIEVKTYPNPFINELTIELPAEHPYQFVELIDAQGRALLRRDISTADNHIHFYADEKWIVGMYFLRLHAPNEVRVEQVLKVQ